VAFRGVGLLTLVDNTLESCKVSKLADIPIDAFSYEAPRIFQFIAICHVDESTMELSMLENRHTYG
jgi:hypothetical protein